MDDDFTFPAAAAAAEPQYTLCLHHHHGHGHRPLTFPDHFASSPPLWFAAAAPAALVNRAVDMEGEEPSTLDAGRRWAEGGRDGDGDDEEPVRGGGAGAEGEDKMDLLWENFNEELEALRRAGSCSKAAACGGLELSDTESEPATGRERGCAPMLMASSRASGTGHYRRTSSWVLLMRIFRRLFVVEKTISAARRQQGRAP